MAPILRVLFEHATGYSLFAIKEFEEVSAFLPQVERAVLDVSKFKSSIVDLVAFSPFKTAINALENINAVSEGVVHDDLQLFLETNLPKKKSKFILGLGDAKLAATINEQFGYSCTHVGIVPEVLRGIRLHFAKLIEDLSEYNCSKAQLGLGHSYSRSKVKFNVNRVDNMIIQSIAILDQLDKDINVFAMRVREWYSYHYPELVKIVNDNHMYAKVHHLSYISVTLNQRYRSIITNLAIFVLPRKCYHIIFHDMCLTLAMLICLPITMLLECLSHRFIVVFRISSLSLESEVIDQT